MFSALYFPHTELSTHNSAGERLLKRALLLWDRLEFIVPYPEYTPHYQDSLVAEAIELIGKNHYPNEQEKADAHERITELVSRPDLPESFYYTGLETYDIYPQKFLPKTWDLMERARLAIRRSEQGHSGHQINRHNFPLRKQAGLAVMAILADSCAGTTRSRVTDRARAYASLTGLLSDQSEEGRVRDRAVDVMLRSMPRRESLITLRLSLIDVDALSLQQLVNLRKREYAEAGHNLRDLRHRYLQRVEGHVKELTTNPNLTTSDVEELERVFAQQCVDDLAALKDDFHAEIRNVVLSKDVLVTLLVGAGMLATALFPTTNVLNGVFTKAGTVLTLGGIVGARSKFLDARAAFLRRHPMAFVYELGQS